MPLGHATFHLTFFSGPISTGGCCPSATPDPFGPRNCGHGEPSAARVGEPTTSTTRQASLRILHPLRREDGASAEPTILPSSFKSRTADAPCCASRSYRPPAPPDMLLQVVEPRSKLNHSFAVNAK